MVNRNFTDLEAAGTALPDYSRAYDANKALNAAATAKADTEFAVQWAGQGAPLVREMPAATLVNLLVAEMND